MPYSGRKVNNVPLKAYSLPEQRRQRNRWTSGRSILIMLSTVTVVSLRFNSFYNNDVARLKLIVWVISTNERVLSLIILGWRLGKKVKFGDTLNNFCLICFLPWPRIHQEEMVRKSDQGINNATVLTDNCFALHKRTWLSDQFFM